MFPLITCNEIERKLNKIRISKTIPDGSDKEKYRLSPIIKNDTEYKRKKQINGDDKHIIMNNKTDGNR